MKANIFSTRIISVEECFYPCSQREAQIHGNTPYQTTTKIRRNCLYICQGIWTYRFAKNPPMYHFQVKKGTWCPHPVAPYLFQRTHSPTSRRLKVTCTAHITPIYPSQSTDAVHHAHELWKELRHQRGLSQACHHKRQGCVRSTH